MTKKYFVKPIDTIRQVRDEYKVVRTYGVYYMWHERVITFDEDDEKFKLRLRLEKAHATEKLAQSYADLRNQHPKMTAV